MNSMDNDIDKAVNALREALKPGHIGTVMLVLDNIGSLVVRDGEVSTEPCATDCTLSAPPEVFLALLNGDISPRNAYLAGTLRIDGSFSAAMAFARLII